MELYIAEYLVENGFANDMISALKILHVVSDDWYDELLSEVEIKWNTGTLKGSGKSPANTAKMRQSQLRTRRGRGPKDIANTTRRFAIISGNIKKADELSKIRDPRPETTDTRMGREGRRRINTGYATHKDTPISSVGTTADTDREIVDLRTGRRMGSSSSSDTLTGGRYANRDTAGGRRTNRSRTGGTYGTRGSSRP